MKMTEEGLQLIKEFEGFRGMAYRDPVGVWTIGYGHTSMAGAPDVKPGMVLTLLQANDVLKRDVETFAQGVSESLQRTLSPQQFSALVSFAYNVGLGNFRKSSVLKAVNAGDVQAVPRRLQLWTKAGGRTLPGLVRRRAAEAALFVTKGAEVVQSPAVRPDAPVPKPMIESRTVGAVVLAMVASLLQVVLKGVTFGLGLALIVIVLALLAFVLRERLLKLKDEVL
jgi:lysozyme